MANRGFRNKLKLTAAAGEILKDAQFTQLGKSAGELSVEQFFAEG